LNQVEALQEAQKDLPAKSDVFPPSSSLPATAIFSSRLPPRPQPQYSIYS
jgi:hypothetical protein